MKKKEDRNAERIVAAMDAVDKAVLTLTRLAAKYDPQIDRAALMKQEPRVKQLIYSKLYLTSLAENLITLKEHLQRSAYSGQALASLASLPEAIEGCRGILSQSPDFKKLGVGMEKLFKEMQAPEHELEKLNQTIAGIMNPPAEFNRSRVDGIGEVQEKESEAFQAEYAAMLERVKGKVAQAPVVPPTPAQTNVPTGNFDVASIIQEENKK